MSETDPPTVVLVVDDSPETLGMLTEALERVGWTVLVAPGGAEALRVVERVTPDIVLLDAVMPGMDGFETCRRLKTQPGLAHVPVIFMTGLRETGHIVEGLEAGGVDYVTKPISLDEMIARIRVHLANARLTSSARAALDSTGRFLLAAGSNGRLRWSTPQAARLLATVFPDFNPEGFDLPDPVRLWLAARAEGRSDHQSAQLPGPAGGPQLTLSFIGRMERDETLLRITDDSASSELGALKDRFGVTTREAEVLLWIARGKANRDIAEILGMSPRTVNKHLEQIYVKLGVENRAAAAATAVRSLG
ncbi:response regulator transcription factor [Hansschlegelia plantiphila]|uniref:DNA-binding response regulator n=1 Tax=Hansschlegelia plantiphila TaxID=374655 RepID=A0A9W6J0C3_9HYPH|nr:response regulator transcription factor [Hansschlegelia plantiphila]GLK68017.1 DNA-binding response regulator [Hansschlegelia plantiphila]